MHQGWLQQHFPTLLGHLPRMMISASRRLMTGIQECIHEFLLGISFVGLFITLAVRTWGDFFFIQGLVTAAVLLFASYLLLVLMINACASDEL